MSNDLNNIENEILELLYKKKFDLEFKIYTKDLPLTEEKNYQENEAGYYLNRLKRLGYLEFEAKEVNCGGRINPKYKNNINLIYWENIDISDKGRNYIKQRRKSWKDKICESIRNFINDIVKEFRSKVISHLVSFIIGIIFSYIYYVIIIK